MCAEVTEGIKVSAVAKYVEEKSDPHSGLYVFNYTITIENQRGNKVQLIERHWKVNSAGELIAEVVGPGVVGMHPVLENGEAFEYTSAAVINTPVGSMNGSYTFRSEEGHYIEVPIPEFDLFTPEMIH